MKPLIALMATCLLSMTGLAQTPHDHLSGVIESIDYDAMTLQLATADDVVAVQADEETMIRIAPSHEMAEFGELEVGMMAAIAGDYEDEIFVAFRIMVRGEFSCEMFHGTITEIDYDAMTFLLVGEEIEDTFVQVTEDTRIKGHHETLEFTDLEDDMEVVVAGEFDEDVLMAAVVKVYYDCPLE
jgi:hypothetical protein